MKNEEKNKMLDALENKSDEEIDEEFSDMIRNELDEKQFWDWVSGWKDANTLCDQAEDWDTETKREELRTLKEFIK